MEEKEKKVYEAPVIEEVHLEESFAFGMPPLISPSMP